jgi:hypothetical protein
MPQVIYRSTDTSAPVLTGQAGTMVTVLDACLVNGYGSKAAAGWTKVYSGTNKAAYQMGDGDLDYFLQIRDDGSVTSDLETNMAGYVTMSDVDTGTERWPAATGSLIRKSNTIDATARPWAIAADESTVHIWTKFNGSNYVSHTFGEYYSFYPSDSYRVINYGRSTSTSLVLAMDAAPQGGPNAAAGGLHMFWEDGSNSTGGLHRLMGATSNPGGPFPNQYDGFVYLGRQLISLGNIRGYLRGVYEMFDSGTGCADGDTFSGTGDFAGRTFQILKGFSNTNRAYAIETSAWDAN